jgi:hypothetical protein
MSIYPILIFLLGSRFDVFAPQYANAHASIGAEFSPPKPQPPLIGRFTDVVADSLRAVCG